MKQATATRDFWSSYEHYRKQYGLEWEKPHYWIPEALPKIPLESKIDMIISASSKKLALKLLISKETGLRPIEIVTLKARDVDLEKGLIFPATAKNGSPRVLKITTK